MLGLLDIQKSCWQRLALVVVGRAGKMPESKKKPEARKMLVEAAESPPSTARFVRRRAIIIDSVLQM